MFAWTVLVAAVLVEWPVRGALFPVALAISLYTVAATMKWTAALAAPVLATASVLPPAAGQGWLAQRLAARDLRAHVGRHDARASPNRRGLARQCVPRRQAPAERSLSSISHAWSSMW